MKKIVSIMMLCGILFAPLATVQAETRDAGAATLLSLVMPGTGEWYNNEWRGAFPWGECILGSLCFLVRWSSAIDAANGNTDEAIRLDFWSAPSN